MVGILVVVTIGIVAAILGLVLLFTPGTAALGTGILIFACFVALLGRVLQADRGRTEQFKRLLGRKREKT